MLCHIYLQSFQTAISNCYLVTLPPKIILIILGYLQDLDYLFSTILTYWCLFDIFWNGQQKVIESILSRYIPLKTDHAIFRALNVLRFIIRQDVIQRTSLS
jgi:hypothetical protein